MSSRDDANRTETGAASTGEFRDLGGRDRANRAKAGEGRRRGPGSGPDKKWSKGRRTGPRQRDDIRRVEGEPPVISFPEPSLVVLVGATGSGKSTFGKEKFAPGEVLSSDTFRGLVSNDENDQSASDDAFELLHQAVAIRLRRGLTTVVDATNLKSEDRAPLVQIANRHHALPVAIVLQVDERDLRERNAQRADRAGMGDHVIPRHAKQLRAGMRWLRDDGFRNTYLLDGAREIDAVQIERTRPWSDKTAVTGPFDLIGDVHGCLPELEELLAKLGWTVEDDPDRSGRRISHPDGRILVFVGDLVDRGPSSAGVLRLVMNAVADGVAFAVPGNHDDKLKRWLKGSDVRIAHGLESTIAEFEDESDEFKTQVKDFLFGLTSHLAFDGGDLVVAHAGVKEEMQQRMSGAVRDFCLYGETTGETDEFGFQVRWDWAQEYRGDATVVYGHTPVPTPEWVNKTINIDTGCAFGGKLTALRWPERTLVSVDARQTYYEPVRPLVPDGASASADVLDLDDVQGKRGIQTTLYDRITIDEANAITALEVMSRFACDPRWLVYLPPTMSPVATSKRDGYLEHPAEAFDYFRHRGVGEVVCEEKHMGSRAVVIVCRDAAVAKRAFGVDNGEAGIVYTRTGRRFFDREREMEEQLLARVRTAMDASKLWDELDTDWIVLDCELMPWSAKARELLRSQYAAVGSASRNALSAVRQVLETTAARSPEDEAASALRERFTTREDLASKFTDAYRRYCWDAPDLDAFKLAPFHILATEGASHEGCDHVWHMETIKRLCAADEALLLATPYRVVQVFDDADCDAASAWWDELVSAGGEGMVVKPRDFVAHGSKGLLQPAVKVRGPEYLRIIYGPEYTLPENLERLRERGLGRKRSLALREFALGIEGLQRFVRHDGLARVHECAFGVLALESEPTDPRL